MLPVLLGVPGKLKTLLDRLTSTRAGYLDAAISSRAEGGTVYSSARAALLDYLDADVSSRAVTPTVQTGYVSVLSGSLTAGTGEDAKYHDVTVDAVSATDSVVCLFQYNNGASGGWFSARMTTTTNLRLSSGASINLYGRWYVIDYGA